VVFAISAVLLFAFIYWQTALHETDRIDRFLTDDAKFVAAQSQEEIYRAVSSRILGDLHRISYAALFDRAGTRLAGNLAEPPANLPPDGVARAVEGVRLIDDSVEAESVRAVARVLPDGDLLVIGRNVDALETLGSTVLRALELGVIPAMLLAIGAGAFVSWRAQQRVKAVQLSTERIMYGDLSERLPTRGTDDDFDRLARNVNLMLDEIRRLLDNVKEAGNDIAHDLRTPLARLRARLERSRESATDREELRATIGSAITDLDQTLAVITTLLRIGEIESGARRGAYETFDLGALAEEVAQIYQPLAEEKGVALTTRIEPNLTMTADRALMVEALANLVQNGIKFTPPNGHVAVVAAASPEGPVLRVADDGPGIPERDRTRVFQRFYRVDKSRHIEGSGLGLSLVDSIVRSHGFTIALKDAEPGCIAEIVCRARPAKS